MKYKLRSWHQLRNVYADIFIDLLSCCVYTCTKPDTSEYLISYCSLLNSNIVYHIIRPMPIRGMVRYPNPWRWKGPIVESGDETLTYNSEMWPIHDMWLDTTDRFRLSNDMWTDISLVARLVSSIYCAVGISWKMYIPLFSLIWYIYIYTCTLARTLSPPIVAYSLPI